MQKREYNITFTKDLVAGLYVSKITQEGLKHGIIIETPVDAMNGISSHVEEIKDIFELKITSYYNKLKQSQQ